MRTFLKWLGIIFGALLLLAVIAAPLLLGSVMRRGMFFSHGFDGMRAMHAPGIFWLLGGGMFLGRMLFPLLIVGLLFWLAYSLGRGAAQRRAVQNYAPTGTQPAAVGQPAATQPAVGMSDAAPADAPATTACPNCARALQPGWVACPYCGQKL